MSRVYATAAEFQNHPTNLDVSSLVPNGTTEQNAAELALIMQMASSYAEQITYTPLYARTITNEILRVRPDGYGNLEVRLKFSPIASLVSAQWRQYQSTSYSAINLANVDLYPQYGDGHKYIAGDLNYGSFYGWGQPPLTVQTTYVAGYANAVLADACTAGSTSLVVDNVLGISVGDTMTVYDGAYQEDVVVSAIDATTETLTLDTGTLYAHAVGVRVSELPPAVSVATIYLAAWMIKERRAGGGFVMQGTVQGLDTRVSEDVQMAKENLKPFVRVI